MDPPYRKEYARSPRARATVRDSHELFRRSTARYINANKGMQAKEACAFFCACSTVAGSNRSSLFYAGLGVDMLKWGLGATLDDAEDSQADAERLRLIYAASQVSGLSLDLLELLTRGLDSQAVRICCDNASTLPLNKKSNEVP